MSFSDSNAQRVLIVDDEPNIAVAIEFLMQRSGFDTEVAFNGKDALTKARRFRPHLMILDVMMPLMDGYEVAHELRKDDGFRNLQIVFLTAKSAARDKRKGYGSGGDLYLAKPFDNRELVEEVRLLLETA